VANVTISGGADLARALKGLGDLARAEVLRNAVIAGSLPILTSAQDAVPVSTGTLKRSLHTEIVEERDGYAEAGTGTDVEYAARIEFGFSGQDSRGRTYDQPAKPYLRPAFDTQQAAAVSEMEAALRQQLDHLVG
jgi:HK97 gp10 family phage protein